VTQESQKTGKTQHRAYEDGADEGAVDGIEDRTEAHAYAVRGDVRQNDDEQESVKPKPFHGLAAQHVCDDRVNEAGHDLQRQRDHQYGRVVRLELIPVIEALFPEDVQLEGESEDGWQHAGVTQVHQGHEHVADVADALAAVLAGMLVQ